MCAGLTLLDRDVPRAIPWPAKGRLPHSIRPPSTSQCRTWSVRDFDPIWLNVRYRHLDAGSCRSTGVKMRRLERWYGDDRSRGETFTSCGRQVVFIRCIRLVRIHATCWRLTHCKYLKLFNPIAENQKCEVDSFGEYPAERTLIQTALCRPCGCQLFLRSRQFCRIAALSNRPERMLGQGASGGGSGIRTHGGLAPTPVFKTGALNRSAIPPS